MEISAHQPYHCKNKFHQHGSKTPAPLWKRGTGILESCGSRPILFPISYYLVLCSVAFHKKMMPNSRHFRRELRVVFIRARGLSKKVSRSTPSIPCIMRQSRIAARHSSGTRKLSRVDWERWMFQGCSPFQDREILLHLTKNSICSENPEFESMIGSQWKDPSCAAQKIHLFLLVLLDLFLRNKFLVCLQFLGNFSCDSRWIVGFSCPILDRNCSSLFEPDPPIGSLDVAVIFVIQDLEESHKELLLNFSVPIFWFPHQLQLQTVFFWAAFSTGTADSAFRSIYFWRICLSDEVRTL